ncbi:Anthranilate phosphoribosyltransferase [compost metagenome]
MIVLNAGAALYAADHATSLREGVQLAQDALHTGLAWEKLDELVSFTAVFKQENEA